MKVEENGFSLVESIIALLIASMLLGGVLAIYSGIALRFSTVASDTTIYRAADNLLSEARSRLRHSDSLPGDAKLGDGHLTVKTAPYTGDQFTKRSDSINLVKIIVQYQSDDTKSQRDILSSLEVLQLRNDK